MNFEKNKRFPQFKNWLHKKTQNFEKIDAALIYSRSK